MKRRTINVFSLSFLDVMFCGFGAVILFFMIINADSQARRGMLNASTQDEVQALQVQVTEAERSLAELQDSLQGLEARHLRAQDALQVSSRTSPFTPRNFPDSNRRHVPGCKPLMHSRRN